MMARTAQQADISVRGRHRGRRRATDRATIDTAPLDEKTTRALALFGAPCGRRHSLLESGAEVRSRNHWVTSGYRPSGSAIALLPLKRPADAPRPPDRRPARNRVRCRPWSQPGTGI